MAGVPINFAIPAESAIVSFDWTDFALGLGYKKFYCVATQQESTTTYFLSSERQESDAEVGFRYNVSGATNATFDITFGKKLILAVGTAMFRITMNSGTSSGNFAETTATLSHVRGGVVTQICTAKSGQVNYSGDPQTQTKVWKAAIASKFIFAKGDTLRLVLTFNSNNSSSYHWFLNGSDSLYDCYTTLPFEVNE
jgi:hypothetical protein